MWGEARKLGRGPGHGKKEALREGKRRVVIYRCKGNMQKEGNNGDKHKSKLGIMKVPGGCY